MNTSEIAELIADLKPRFLEGLSSTELRVVLSAAKHRRYLANSVVTNEGHPANHLFLLLKGRGRFFAITPDGQKTVTRWLPPGDVFGGASIVSKASTYVLSAEMVMDSEMLVWERVAIRRLARKYFQITENALLIALDYMVFYRSLHISRTCHTARQRVATVLVNLANGIGQKVPQGIELDINNEELASESNVTLFTTSRLLSEWQRNGLVTKTRGKVLLRSPQRLLSNVV